MHHNPGGEELDLADLWGASSDDGDSPFVSLFGTAERDPFLRGHNKTEQFVTQERQLQDDSMCQAHLRLNDSRDPSQPLAGSSPTPNDDQQDHFGHWSSTPASGYVAPKFPLDGFPSGPLAPHQPAPTTTDQQLTVTDGVPYATEGFFHPRLPSTPPSCPARSTPVHALALQPLTASHRCSPPTEAPDGEAPTAAGSAAPYRQANQHGYRYPQQELQQQRDQLTASSSGALLGGPFGSDGGTTAATAALAGAGPVGMSSSQTQQPPSATQTPHPHPRRYSYPHPYPYPNRSHPLSPLAAGAPPDLPHRPPATRPSPHTAAISSYPYGALQDEYGNCIGPCTPPKSTWRFPYPPNHPPAASPFGPHAPGPVPRYPGKLWPRAPPYPPPWPHGRPAPHTHPPFAYGYPYPHPHPHPRAFPYPPHPAPGAAAAAAAHPDHQWPWHSTGRPTATTATTGTATAAAAADTAGLPSACPHPHAAGWQPEHVPQWHPHQQHPQQQQPAAVVEEDNGSDTATSRATTLHAAAPDAVPTHQHQPPPPPQQHIQQQHERPGARVPVASLGAQQVQLPAPLSLPMQSPQQPQQQDDLELAPPAAEGLDPLWPLSALGATAGQPGLPWGLPWEAPQPLGDPPQPQLHPREAAAGMWCDAADAEAGGSVADAGLPLLPPLPPLPPLEPGLGLPQALLRTVHSLEGSHAQVPEGSFLAAVGVKAEPESGQQQQEQQQQQQQEQGAAAEGAEWAEQDFLAAGRRASVRARKARSQGASAAAEHTVAAAPESGPGAAACAGAYEGKEERPHPAAEPVPGPARVAETPAKEPLPKPVQVTVSSPSGALMTHRVLGTFFPQPYLEGKECILVLRAPAGGGQGQGSKQGQGQQQRGEGQDQGTGGAAAAAGAAAGSGGASPTKGGGGGGGSKKGGAAPVGGVGDMVSRSGFERLSGSMMAKWHRSIRVSAGGGEEGEEGRSVQRVT